MYQYSQTVGLRGRREETQTSASGQGGSPGSAGFVHMPLLVPLAAPHRGAAAGRDGIGSTAHQEMDTRTSCSTVSNEQCCQGLCLATQ